MSVYEKQNLIDRIREQLASRFTAEQLEDVARAAAEVLNDFSVVREQTGTITAGDRDIFAAFIQARVTFENL